MCLTMAVGSSLAAPLCIACLNTRRAAWHTHIGTPRFLALRYRQLDILHDDVHLSAVIEAARQDGGREFALYGTSRARQSRGAAMLPARIDPALVCRLSPLSLNIRGR